MMAKLGRSCRQSKQRANSAEDLPKRNIIRALAAKETCKKIRHGAVGTRKGMLDGDMMMCSKSDQKSELEIHAPLYDNYLTASTLLPRPSLVFRPHHSPPPPSSPDPSSSSRRPSSKAQTSDFRSTLRR